MVCEGKVVIGFGHFVQSGSVVGECVPVICGRFVVGCNE